MKLYLDNFINKKNIYVPITTKHLGMDMFDKNLNILRFLYLQTLREYNDFILKRENIYDYSHKINYINNYDNITEMKYNYEYVIFNMKENENYILIDNNGMSKNVILKWDIKSVHNEFIGDMTQDFVLNERKWIDV